ncbi:mCG147391 [Mus musculus]|nr:mCG147391 [Mus musculus]
MSAWSSSSNGPCLAPTSQFLIYPRGSGSLLYFDTCQSCCLYQRQQVGDGMVLAETLGASHGCGTYH